MFGKYALPSDDAAQYAVSVTASAEDSEYPAINLIGPSDTGHGNRPSRPAKLTETSGTWDILLPSAQAIVGAAFIYHNWDPGLDVTLEAGSGSGGSPFGSFSQAVTVPALPDADDPDFRLSPWVLFDAPQTYDAWRVSINAPNSLLPQLGRLLLLTAIRTLGTDVRYGEEEYEERLHLAQPTFAGLEVLTDLFGVRRSFAGEFGFIDEETNALQALWRSAKNRIRPWLLIPDVTVNDAWYVRFEEALWQRTRETVGVAGTGSYFNVHPFRVKEVSRGVPWP